MKRVSIDDTQNPVNLVVAKVPQVDEKFKVIWSDEQNRIAKTHHQVMYAELFHPTPLGVFFKIKIPRETILKMAEMLTLTEQEETTDAQYNGNYFPPEEDPNSPFSQNEVMADTPDKKG